MKMLRLVSLFVIITLVKSECPCSDVDLCKPLQVGSRHEKLAFMTERKNWLGYDYSQLTTIVICTSDFDSELLCLAHSKKVRLVWIAEYDVKQLGNETARTIWIRNQVDKVKSTYTDGINLDTEAPIADGSPAAQQYTQLVRDLSTLIHDEVPGSMVMRKVDTELKVIFLRRLVLMLLGVHRALMAVVMIIKVLELRVTFFSLWPMICVHKSSIFTIVLRQPILRLHV